MTENKNTDQQKENSLDSTSSWLKWATEIQAIAQTGLTYSQGVFDQERYKHLMEIAAQILSTYSHHSQSKILELFNQQAGYATPKIDVRGAVFQDQQILLVKEISDQQWTLPGGFADVNLSPSVCVQKEVLEESGYEVAVTKLIAFYDKLKHNHPAEWPHIYKCFFLCELTGGQAKTSIETSEVAFFPLDQLPALSLPRVTQAQILRCYEHYKNPELPTDFD